VATATNLPLSESSKIASNPRLEAALIDRLTFRTHIIETGSDLWRLRTTKIKSAS
jgi:DNA replication protein DnaC